MKIKHLLLFLFVQTSFYGQNRTIDSLKQLTPSAKDTTLVNVYNRLGKEYEFINQDSSLVYIDKALHLSHTLNYNKGKGIAYTYKGYLQEDRSEFDSAIFSYSNAHSIYLKTGEKSKQAHLLKLLGEAERYKGDLKEALSYFQQSLTLSEEIGSKQSIADVNYSIGGLFQDMKRYDKSMEHYQKCLEINRELKSPIDLANAITAVGIQNNYLKNYKAAKENYAEAKKMYEDLKYDNGLSNCLTWMAITAYNEKDIPTALNYFMASLEIYERINSVTGLMYAYNNIGSIYTEQGNHQKAIEWEKKGLDLAIKSKGLEYIKYSYEMLSASYAKMGDYKNAYDSHKLFMQYTDSLLNENTTRQLSEMDKKFETAKKDKELILKDAEISKQEAETAKQTTQRNYFIFGFALMLILVLFVYRGYRAKQKANEIIADQKRKVEIQKELIEEKQKEIVDSITYAKRLQQAILPPANFVNQYLPQNFILFKPKDIVAGDFYWMEVVPDTILIAAADCTGHGVPGAMVSVVCSNALNRTVKEFGITEPGKILDKVRELVIETFEKSESEVKDGMDISLCSINLKNLELKWAGANNSLWYFQNNEMKVVVGNKQPIGISDRPQPFTTNTIQLNKGEQIYLFSDGFADQFGGTKGKKFKYKQLKDMLIANQHKSMADQKSNLETVLEIWKGPLEQVDDILVIGVRV